MKQLKYQLQTSAPAKPPSFLLPLLQIKAVAATRLGTRINLQGPPGAKRTGAAPAAAPAGRASAPRHLVGSPLPGRRGCFMKEKPLGRPVLVAGQPGCSRGRSPPGKTPVPTSPADAGGPGSSGACGAAGRAGEGLGTVFGLACPAVGSPARLPGARCLRGQLCSSGHPRSGSPLCRERAPGPRCCALSLIRGIVRRSIIRC